jgi:hypothetical protein
LKLDGFGVFNDQCFRQIIFFDLNYACRFEAFVETGTFVGCTAAFMARNVSAPVYTAEIDPRNFELAKRRLRGIPNAHIVNANSTKFLASLPLAPTTRTFFYLDAHWYDYLPLADETELIFSKFRDFVVMVDDFAVPGDEGYGYADYGPGKQLSLRDFHFHKDPRLAIYFPQRSSSRESGNRRGCIVIASLTMCSFLDDLDCLTRMKSA